MMKTGEKMRKNRNENRCWIAMKMIPTSPNATMSALFRISGYPVDKFIIFMSFAHFAGLGACIFSMFWYIVDIIYV